MHSQKAFDETSELTTYNNWYTLLSSDPRLAIDAYLLFAFLVSISHA